MDPPDVPGSTVAESVPSASRTPLRWLNVVLDLNGILCVCEERKYSPRGLTFLTESDPHSSTVPAAIGPKALYVRPMCAQFLSELSEIADISVWSSMKRETTIQICRYLFKDTIMPVHVLGQEDCDRIKVLRNKRLSFMKVPGTNKDVFLKTLKKHLYNNFNGRFKADNTIIVDDSAIKHVLNKPANVVLLDSWSYKGEGSSDSFLMEKLLSWISRLYYSRDQGIKSFRKSDELGGTMMCDDPFSVEYNDIIAAIEQSEKM